MALSSDLHMQFLLVASLLLGDSPGKTICDVTTPDSGLNLVGKTYTRTTARPGPCVKEGLVPDEDNPRVYYRCTWNRQENRYDFETFVCEGDTWFNEQIYACSNNNSSEFTCLKKNLDHDASRICYEETLRALEEELEVFVDAAAYRGDPPRNFHLSVKDIHLNMRDNYRTLIENTGKNIYPLIVATDNDTPELAGTGGAYKVYFRNGTMKRIVPVSKDFELHKCLSHMVLGIFAIIAPYFRAPKSTNWQPAMKTFQQKVKDAQFSLSQSQLPTKEFEHTKTMLQKVDRYVTACLKDNTVTRERFHEFSNDLAPLIDKSMQIAAKAHVTATIPALQALKAEFGETEWRKVYVLIPTVWPVSLYNIRLQAFRKVMDFKQIKQQVLITEGARSEEEARTTLGRIVADRALALLVFGDLDQDSMRDHLFSLSTRRDLLSSVEEEAIDKWCGGEDDWSILMKSLGDPKAKSRCPMSKHMATMLRQSP